jgi:16S rRNA (adenine1518-N6/adenine1519-N6)-dimethyltransferase
LKFKHNTEIGQNFLVDPSVAEWMTRRAGLSAADAVLEIGPGSGALTRTLLSSPVSRLDAIEIDARLAEYLEPIASRDARLRLHWGDAVRFPYGELPAPSKIIANLPFHITTPVIWTLLENYCGTSANYMLLMTQAEAAERIARGAGARTSNPLSVTIAAAGRAEIVRKIPRTAFYPRPEVDSAIVEIRLGENSPLSILPRDEKWRRLLAGSFSVRRKTLANNWKNAFAAPREKSAAILAALSLKPLVRAEELSLADWLALYENAPL